MELNVKFFLAFSVFEPLGGLADSQIFVIASAVRFECVSVLIC